ncbi:hypothetical protein Bca52824_035356 [Brassica carinata]|uniref:Uncharacterized protein n=1 Tax=Brassica carinata TaxID=52824 RepID=A0A8X7S7F3_BRACI|nr:hypothetical protein Bca52824_035356 [Brassica carinata]
MTGCPVILRVFLCSWNSSCSLRRRKHSSPGSSASSDRRQVDILVGSAADDSFAAYQEAAKVISAKRGSASRKVSGNDVVVTSSRRATMVKTEPTSSSQGRNTRGGRVMTRASHQSADMGRSVGTLAKALTNLNLSVFPRDGTILPVGDTSEVIQALQGGLLRTVTRLFHLGERLSTEDASFVREDLEALKREASEEKYRRMAPELEIRDLKEKLKASEKIAEEASTDALATRTVFRPPRQNYYRYLLGSRNLPLGSWPLSSPVLHSAYAGSHCQTLGVLVWIRKSKCQAFLLSTSREA